MYLLAAFSRYPTAEENTSFVIFGFAFVLFVLLALAIMTGAIGVLFKRIEANRKKMEALAPKPSAPAPQVQPPAAASEENEHLPFLIAAAVATIMEGQAHRIVSVNPRSEGWAQEGRRQIFSSHRVR